MSLTYLYIQQDAVTRGGGSAATVKNDYPFLGGWINQKYHELSTIMKWGWSEAVKDMQMTSGTQYITTTSIGSDYRNLKDIRLVDQGYAWKLKELDVAVVDRARPLQTGASFTGTPRGYYIWGGRVYFDVVPDQNYNIEARYYKYDPDMQVDSDTPNLPLEAQQILPMHGYSMILKQKYIFDQASYVDKQIDALTQGLIQAELEKTSDELQMVDLIEPPTNY